MIALTVSFLFSEPLFNKTGETARNHGRLKMSISFINVGGGLAWQTQQQRSQAFHRLRW
jgi:hypothetical protein